MVDYILKFTDGTQIQFAAGSTITDLIGVYESFAEIDSVRAKLTEQNLRGVTFNDKVYENLTPYQIDIHNVTPDGKIETHFRLSAKGAIDILNDQIVEIQEALAEIAG